MTIHAHSIISKPTTATTSELASVTSETTLAQPPTPTAPRTLSISFPPADAHIPVAPATSIATNGTDYKGVQPKAPEQAALPSALEDLEKFTDYQAELGAGAPPIGDVILLLMLGIEWTGMRNATAAWDVYCRTQEGLVWARLRTVMERLKPAWEVATTANGSLASKYPGLASLLGAKKAIAQKAALTKALNKKAIAEGRLPLHGVVGKQRKKGAKNAAYAAATTENAGRGGSAGRAG
jgi:hypothetical protein